MSFSPALRLYCLKDTQGRDADIGKQERDLVIRIDQAMARNGKGTQFLEPNYHTRSEKDP